MNPVVAAKLPPQTPEQLWRHFSQMAQENFRRSSDARTAADENMAWAVHFRSLVPPERIAEIEAERFARIEAGA